MERLLQRKTSLLFMLAMAVLGFFLYANVLHGQFQFDDYPVIVNNEVIRDANPFTLWQNVHHPTRYVAYLTFAINYALHGLNPFGFRLFNLLLHLMNAGLVFGLVSLLLRTPWNQATKCHTQWWCTSGICALIFLAHPVQTESVSYITQRFTSLATLFYLLASCCYLKGRMIEGGRKKWIWFAGGLISAIAGMLTKQILLTLPLMIVAIELLFFPARSRRGLRWLIGIALLSLFVIPSLYGFDVSRILGVQYESGSHRGDWITSASYLRTQPSVIMTYIKVLLYPFSLNLLYDFPLSQSFLEPKTLASILGIIGLLVIAFIFLKRDRFVTFGILWFLGTLLVESTIIPIRHVIFEHRTYLPSLGFFLVVTVTLIKLVKNTQYLAILGGLMMILLSVGTVTRNHVWADGVRMWQDVVLKSPHQAKPYYNLGYEFLRDAQLGHALDQFSKALEIHPDYFDAYHNRSQIYFSRGDLKRALADVNHAIRVNPNRAEAFVNRGLILRHQLHFAQALKDFDRAIELNQDNAIFLLDRGLTLGNLGQHHKALADLNRAIMIKPDFHKAYNVRASLHLALGQFQSALDDFDQAIELDGKNASYYRNRAQTRMDMRQLDLALKDLNQAVEIEPNNIENYSRRAYLLSRMQLTDPALADYARILEQQPELLEIHLERGKILYRQGKYSKAIQEFNHVLGKNPKESSAYMLRGLSRYEIREFKGALADMTRARQYGQSVDDVYFQRIQAAMDKI